MLIDLGADLTIGGFSYEADDIRFLGFPLVLMTFFSYLYYSIRIKLKSVEHSFSGQIIIEKTIDVMLFISLLIGIINFLIVFY